MTIRAEVSSDRLVGMARTSRRGRQVRSPEEMTGMRHARPRWNQSPGMHTISKRSTNVKWKIARAAVSGVWMFALSAGMDDTWFNRETCPRRNRWTVTHN